MSKIAILGYGIVGSGTVEVFYKNKENLEKKMERDLDIKYILDRLDFTDSPYYDKFTKDFELIVNDFEVEVVVELLGGKTFAYDCVKRSLLAGKNVVTSNKELVATHGAELLKLAKENSVNFFFEASVGGGIPIIRPLHQCLLSDKINGIAGILNGTTNFILTKMVKDNMEFNNALSLAQELGYAESNPTDDVDGYDTSRKICILASLVFGKHIYPESVRTQGISCVSIEDLDYARDFRATIKLIGYTKNINDKIVIIVSPMFISEENQLAGVNDVFNAILVSGESTGEVLFYGKGAGKYPTASAVVSDIVNALKMKDTSKSLDWSDSGNQDFIFDYKQLSNKFYIRAKGISREEVNKLFGEVQELKRKNASKDEFAFVTGKIKESELDEKLVNIHILNKIQVFDF